MKMFEAMCGSFRRAHRSQACHKARRARHLLAQHLLAQRLFSSAAILTAGVSGLTPTAARADLDAYIARPEPLYKWEKVGATAGNAQTGDNANIGGNAGGAIHELRLTSQQWQGQAWTHRVQVFRPARVEFPDTALLYATGGSGSAAETMVGQSLASALGATVVMLFNIPNQPLFDQREDALIALTFSKYLESGDATWPLLLPMTKSVVKAMDAVSEFSRRDLGAAITRFVVMGASKRGWTTWLAGAADKRVLGIVPMVYDNLNLQAQMPHQLATWGRYSEMIEDYTRRGLQAQMSTPRGARLAAMVDPYSYRERLTLPKLLVNGTNDPYWALDAFNLYRGGLKGPTNVFYVPNAGHDLGGRAQLLSVLGTVSSWFRRVAAGRSLPSVELWLSPDAKTETNGGAPTRGARRFAVTGGDEIKAARLWLARSASRDFRQAQWQALPMRRENGLFVTEVPAGEAAMPHAAVIGEVEIEGRPFPLRLSSPVHTWSAP